MCGGALAWVQLGKLVYGASDIQRGYGLIRQPVLHPKTEVVSGVFASEAKALIDHFFKQIRG
jgi:tRNA(adenine34) deaminase